MAPPPAVPLTHVVLRARIGVDHPPAVTTSELTDRIADAITAAVVAAGGTLDLLQVDRAARPDWPGFGPDNRVAGDEAWQPLDPRR